MIVFSINKTRSCNNFGFLSDPIREKSSLGELRCATGGFEAVLLTLFHSRITCQEACFFQNRTNFVAGLKQCTGQTVTDGTCLTGHAAACNGADDIEFTESIGQCKGLTNDEFQSIKSEIVVNVSAVDGDFTGAGINSDSGDRMFSSARAERPYRL